MLKNLYDAARAHTHTQKHMHCTWAHKRNNAEYAWLRVTRFLFQRGWRQTAAELTFAVLCGHLNWLNMNLLFTSTHLRWMVCISAVVQGTEFCSGKTTTLFYSSSYWMLPWEMEIKLLSGLGLVHIQSSWPSSTQDISRLGLGCKLWWDGLAGCIFTTKTGKLYHLWLQVRGDHPVLHYHLRQQNNVCIIL